MAVLIHDCPHCTTAKVGFAIIGGKPRPYLPNTEVAKPIVSIGLECPNCQKTASATIQYKKNLSGHSVSAIVESLPKAHDSLPNLLWDLLEFWPRVQPPRIPEFLPKSVEKAFVQGETNLALPGCEEPAATMFRRALDLGLKIRFPDLKGDLYKKVDKLASDHEIPLSLAEWAHEVRVIGNDGAHDLDGCNTDDAQAAHDFVDAVLRYLFSLPGMIAARRRIETSEETEDDGAEREPQ
ncbi:DUF4145 domain-containing protein [Caulobacter segnis]|uniref:DUF4145 domain-containing protein n=2 Tax=Caulobacter segnis TaxID=88688 RepID=D5VHW3_CAUST|nr:DUF4145 domain-containing protein [Caulobacter segnis]ADG09094.1 hypothetical protein Cseg_0582 [Caulobacter segnis ATCC 21756]AVQ00916.1 DUF4145 domain-containing protein [Caulobacter segnis]